MSTNYNYSLLTIFPFIFKNKEIINNDLFVNGYNILSNSTWLNNNLFLLFRHSNVLFRYLISNENVLYVKYITINNIRYILAICNLNDKAKSINSLIRNDSLDTLSITDKIHIINYWNKSLPTNYLYALLQNKTKIKDTLYIGS